MGHDGDGWAGLWFIADTTIGALIRRPGDFLWFWIIASLFGYLAFEYIRATIRQRDRLDHKKQGPGQH